MTTPGPNNQGTPSANGTGHAITAGDVLTRRLDQLRDETWMTAALQSAVTRLSERPLTVESYRIDYCKIKPPRDINVAMHALVREGRDEPRWIRFSATVYPSAELGRVKFGEETTVTLPDPVCRQVKDDGFDVPMTFLPEPAMIVRVFPADPVLVGLGPATDFDLITDHLRPHIPAEEDGPGIQVMSYDVLHFKPRRSCTMRYNLTGTESGHQHAYSKVYRDDRADLCFRLLREAWEASLTGPWRAARPLLHAPAWRLMVQGGVEGRQFRHVFAELTHEDVGYEHLDRVQQQLKAIAVAIRSYQDHPARLDMQLPFAALMESQERNLHYLKTCQPELGAEVARIRKALVRVERETDPNDLVFAHCDFAHGNVLIDEDSDQLIGLIDFDRAGFAEPAFDVAYFLTHLWSFGVRHEKRFPIIASHTEYFRQAYLEIAPHVSPGRLALYEALDFAAYVLRNFRKQSHQAEWLKWAGAQLEAGWARLEVAAGSKGSVPR